MKKFILILSIFIALTRLASAQPPFDPWIVNVAAAEAPQFISECLDDPITMFECYQYWGNRVYDSWVPHLENTWVVPCTPTCELNFLNLGVSQLID